MCCHQKKHSSVTDCQSWKVLRNHPIQLSPFTNGETGPRMTKGLWFSQDPTQCWNWEGERTHCMPGTVLSLSSNLILHLFKYLWSTCCVLAHLLGAGEEIHVYLLLPVLSTFSNHKFQLPVSLPQQLAPKGQKNTRGGCIVHSSVTAVLRTLLKPGEILNTGDNAGLSGLLGKGFLLAWSTWISFSLFQASPSF